GQTALHGAFLWRQVNTVVELKQNWRAREDAPYIDLLNRICVGQARKVALNLNWPSNYDTLKGRLLSTIKQHSTEEFEGFKDAPIIVTKKVLRDAINDSKARTFAHNTNQQFEIYYARDKIYGTHVGIEQQKQLWKMLSTHTNDAIGELPLILGMLFMLTENTATSCRVVNGSRGTLKSIMYKVDPDGYRYAACALVHIPESNVHLPDLEESIVPILPVASSFKFPLKEKKITIRQTQLPNLPGWSFTDYKVQGSSLPQVIVDLACAKSLQSIYVMLSCAVETRVSAGTYGHILHLFTTHDNWPSMHDSHHQLYSTSIMSLVVLHVTRSFPAKRAIGVTHSHTMRSIPACAPCMLSCA
ncbi:hypothetical protein DFJ58DRAFT_667900, partial [Suillus subalutaceus]|uniref:uncharacterized protein n=1 Tax=Suillus subalutaceus TaxID=48586 RepID=UPI001B85F4D6